MAKDTRRVFIIYGRNSKAYESIVQFVHALGLVPKSFAETRSELGGAPYIVDVVSKGMDAAQATIALFSPDEISFLRPELSSTTDSEAEMQRWQSRPNVLFEAGMALAMDRNRTIPVTMGTVEMPSDLGGVHLIRMDNKPHSRSLLKDALKAAGCDINEATKWWDSSVAGDFEACVSAPYLRKHERLSAFSSSHTTVSVRISPVSVAVGDVFSSPSDLLVLPCSTNGTMSRAIVDKIRAHGLKGAPNSLRLGELRATSQHIKDQGIDSIAFAASVDNHSTNSTAIESIGQEIARLARQRGLKLLRCPLLGAGAGGLSALESANALRKGFESDRFEGGTLFIHTLTPEPAREILAAWRV